MKIVTTTIINDNDDGDDNDDDDDDNDGDDDNDRDNQPKLAFNNSLGVLGSIRRFSNYCINPSYQTQTISICSAYAYTIHLKMFGKSE